MNFNFMTAMHELFSQMSKLRSKKQKIDVNFMILASIFLCFDTNLDICEKKKFVHGCQKVKVHFQNEL